MKIFTSTADTTQYEVHIALLFGGAILLPAICVLIWALFFKKKRRHKRKHRRHSSKNRRMNPTLAETGGLPPVRKSENVPEQSKS